MRYKGRAKVREQEEGDYLVSMLDARISHKIKSSTLYIMLDHKIKNKI